MKTVSSEKYQSILKSYTIRLFNGVYSLYNKKDTSTPILFYDSKKWHYVFGTTPLSMFVSHCFNYSTTGRL